MGNRECGCSPDTFPSMSENGNIRGKEMSNTKERKKKKSPGRIIGGILLGLLLVALLSLLGLYGAGMYYFQDKFFLNTRINGVNVSEMTVEQVEEMIAIQINSYQLEIVERGGESEVITAEEIDYHYVSNGEVQTFLDSQKLYTWPLYYWKGISYTFDTSAQFDQELLEQTVDVLECLDEEKAVAPKNAYLDYLEGKFQVLPEVEGNLLEREKTVNLIYEAVSKDVRKISLEDMNCYQIPAKRQNDTGLAATCDKLNTYISTDIVYLFGSNTETLNGEIIRPWLTYDEEGNVEISMDEIYEYVYQLAEKYDTVDKPREFVTHDGEKVSVEGGHYGWLIDQETEAAELLTLIQNGTQGTRYAVFAQTAVSWENSDLGDTYIEIDLGSQHVWMYEDGEEIVSTDCVSGTMTKSDCITPSGTYTLYYKESPSVLKGENNEYETEVTYWMPFNDGIGLHDATWRSSFGGEIYKTNGSHGCINLPLKAAKEIYEHVYDGIPIICYY